MIFCMVAVLLQEGLVRSSFCGARVESLKSNVHIKSIEALPHSHGGASFEGRSRAVSTHGGSLPGRIAPSGVWNGVARCTLSRSPRPQGRSAVAEHLHLWQAQGRS